MDLDQVTLTQMRYAVAVEATQNFRQASAKCHVSQSGLSMQVQKLEELLGVVLFDRSKKPVLVTPEGRAALTQMRNILRETRRLGQIVAEEDEPAGPFRLGVIPTLSPTVLPLFLRDFVARFPRVELTIEELRTDDIIARLRADTLDAGLASTPLHVDGLHEDPLGLEPMFAYLPGDAPLLRKKSVTQTELSQLALWVMPEGHCFRTQVLAYCRGQPLSPPGQVHFESGSFETLVRLVDGGLGATVLPALVVDGLPRAVQRKQVRPLTAPVPVREIGLVTARTDLRRRVSSALSEAIRAALTKALGPKPRRPLTLSPVADAAAG